MAGVQCNFVVLVFQITFGHVGQDTASKTQPRFIHQRYGQPAGQHSPHRQSLDTSTEFEVRISNDE
jgi:hypothetical protein